MRIIKKAATRFTKFLEIGLPSFSLLLLFISFIIGIVFRYVVRNPQNWTFELSKVCFINLGLLGACAAHRTDDHIVFDLLYDRVNLKSKNILRIISNTIIIVFFSYAITPCILYLWGMRQLSTQVMKIPLYIVFFPFIILLISTVLRSLYRLFIDIKALKDKTYISHYNGVDREVQT